MKIIAYCLFGEAEQYRNGLLENLCLAETIYPGWICYVYCDEQNFELLKQTHHPKARIIRQAKQSDGLSGTTWRFNACHEKGVEAILFRDTDSLPGEREKELIDQWMHSKYDVHLIRDHPLHFSPVMAGMFGVKGKAISLLAGMVDRHLASHRQQQYGDDQDFLNTYFYPKIKSRALVHTSYIRYIFEYTAPIRDCSPGDLFIGAYQYATTLQQAEHHAQRQNALPLTQMPYHWQKKRFLRNMFRRIKFQRIAYHCRWCI